MAIAPFMYMQLPSLGMNSHLVDYGGGGGFNRLSLLQKSAQEAIESMQGFYTGEQGMVNGRDGDTTARVRVKQEPFTGPDFGGVGGGKFPPNPNHPAGLTKYHQAAGKMFAMEKYRERDLMMNREKEFIDMVLFQNPAELVGAGMPETGDFSGGQKQRVTEGMNDGRMNSNGVGCEGADEACDLSRRSSTSSGSATTGVSGSSPGSMSPPSPPNRTALMPSPAGGMALSHSPMPYMAGMPLSPMSSMLLSPNSPGIPPPYHPAQTPQSAAASSLYYLHHRGHPMHHHHHGLLHHGRSQPGSKHMHFHVSKNTEKNCGKNGLPPMLYCPLHIFFSFLCFAWV